MSEQITVLKDESLGGVQREYREVKRRAAVGERIKNLRARIDYPEGTISEVLRHDFDGDAVTKDLVGVTRCSDDKSYVVLEPTDILRIDDVRYRMVDRKAAVGDRVISLNDCSTFYKRGNVGIVYQAYSNGDVNADFSGNDYVFGDGRFYLGKDNGYRVLEPLDSASAPLSSRPATEQAAENIATLASRVSALEAQVAELAEAMRKMGVTDDIKSLRSRTDVLESGKPTPQQLRDEIVERAKADVSELADKIKGDWSVSEIPTHRKYGPVTVEFVVNRNKRKVTALIRLKYFPETIVKVGRAKCASGDVFNAHIGKAIALYRALGLDVPAEYLSAPQPTEVRVGDVVTFNDEDAGNTLYRVDALVERGPNCTIIYSSPDFGGGDDAINSRAYGGDFSWARIIDDSRTSEDEDSVATRKEVAAR